MEERKSKARLGCANAASKHSMLAASDICRVQRQMAPFIVQTPCKRMVQVEGGQKRCLHTSACYAVCYAVCKWLVGSLRHAARPEGQAPLQQSTLNQLSTQSARRQTVFLGSRPASRPAADLWFNGCSRNAKCSMAWLAAAAQVATVQDYVLFATVARKTVHRGTAMQLSEPAAPPQCSCAAGWCRPRR